MAFASFKHCKITGCVTVLPTHCISIDDELHYYDNNKEKLERHKKILGLGKRYVVSENMTTFDLCEEAARKLIAEMNIDVSTIDGVIFASTTHDYFIPADSCILHGKLNLNEDCLCYDMSGLGCSAYVHALMSAYSHISCGTMKRCLVLVAEMTSSHSRIENRISNMLHSDAGSATLVEFSEEETLSYFYTGTRGKGWDRIVIPAGGARLPVRADIISKDIVDDNGNVWNLWNEILKGVDVFQFTMEIGPQIVRKLLEYSKLSVDEIDFFPIHQANGQIVTTIAKHTGIPKNKISNETFTKYANCGAVSVLSSICDQLYGKNVSNVMLVSFGVGLSWGGCVVDLSQAWNGGICFFKPSEALPDRAAQIETWIQHFKNQ